MKIIINGMKIIRNGSFLTETSMKIVRNGSILTENGP